MVDWWSIQFAIQSPLHNSIRSWKTKTKSVHFLFSCDPSVRPAYTMENETFSAGDSLILKSHRGKLMDVINLLEGTKSIINYQNDVSIWRRRFQLILSIPMGFNDTNIEWMHSFTCSRSSWTTWGCTIPFGTRTYWFNSSGWCECGFSLFTSLYPYLFSTRFWIDNRRANLHYSTLLSMDI